MTDLDLRIGPDEARRLIRRIEVMAGPSRHAVFAECAAKACAEVVARKRRERVALYEARKSA